jgi:hypothetical protein
LLCRFLPAAAAERKRLCASLRRIDWTCRLLWMTMPRHLPELKWPLLQNRKLKDQDFCGEQLWPSELRRRTGSTCRGRALHQRHRGVEDWKKTKSTLLCYRIWDARGPSYGVQGRRGRTVSFPATRALVSTTWGREGGSPLIPAGVVAVPADELGLVSSAPAG